MTNRKLDELRRKQGYGIVSSFGGGKGLKSEINHNDSGEMPDDEPGSRAEPLAEKRVALRYAGRPVVRFKVFRRRLADYPSANVDKYYVDALIYAGLIKDDSSKEILFIHEGQQKVEKDSEERVEFNIEYPEVDLDELWVENTNKR